MTSYSWTPKTECSKLFRVEKQIVFRHNGTEATISDINKTGANSLVLKLANGKCVKIPQQIGIGTEEKTTKEQEFENELRVADQLRGLPNLMQGEAVHIRPVDTEEADLIRLVDTEQWVPGLLMDTLEEAFDAPFPFNGAKYLHDLGKGLQAMHRAGFAHRDLKLANALRRGNEYMLMDFGKARAADQFADANQFVEDRNKDITDLCGNTRDMMDIEKSDEIGKAELEQILDKLAEDFNLDAALLALGTHIKVSNALGKIKEGLEALNEVGGYPVSEAARLFTAAGATMFSDLAGVGQAEEAKMEAGKRMEVEEPKLMAAEGEEQLKTAAGEPKQMVATKQELSSGAEGWPTEGEEKQLLTAVGKVQTEKELLTAAEKEEPPAKRICLGEEQQEEASTLASTTQTAQGEVDPHVRFAAGLAQMRRSVMEGGLDEERAIQSLHAADGNVQLAWDFYLGQRQFP